MNRRQEFRVGEYKGNSIVDFLEANQTNKFYKSLLLQIDNVGWLTPKQKSCILRKFGELS